MEPNSATANNDDSGAASAAPITMPDNPNELGTEMTQEQEQAFVNATLGIKGEASVEPDSPKDAEPIVPPAEGGEAPEKPAVTQPEPVKPETPPEVVPEPAKVEPAAELAAPQSDDLWIEVKDSEGKDVKLVFDPANPNSFLPEGFTFKDDNQLFAILDAKAEMSNLYKDRLTKFETETAEKTQKDTAIQTDAEQKASWDTEIQDLITGGLLDEPKVKVGDEKFMEDPTVQKVDAIFKFMAEQNTVRAAANQPLLRSFGTAFNLYNANAERVAIEAKTKEDNELAKARGALVGGTSSASSGGEMPVYKRGSANSIWSVKIPE